MSSEKVDQYINEFPENIQAITRTLRKLILNTSLNLVEEYKWSMPNYSYKGLVCYLQASKNHVNLGFHNGNELEKLDVHHLLQGSGKTMRHIRIKSMEDINEEVITEFIEAAMVINE